MKTHVEGPPAIEGIVPMPERLDAWPFMTQAVLVPWEVTGAVGGALGVESLQVMVVPRAEWESLQAQLQAKDPT